VTISCSKQKEKKKRKKSQSIQIIERKKNGNKIASKEVSTPRVDQRALLSKPRHQKAALLPILTKKNRKSQKPNNNKLKVPSNEDKTNNAKLMLNGTIISSVELPGSGSPSVAAQRPSQTKLFWLLITINQETRATFHFAF